MDMRADISEPEHKLKSLRSSLWAAFLDDFKRPSGKIFGVELWRQLGIQVENPIAEQIEAEG